MRSRLNTCKHITWCRKVNKTIIWLSKKTYETNRFKVKNLGKINPTILKVNKSTMIEWKITIDLNPKSKIPHVITNMTMCSSDSTDYSILDLLNTNSHACDFKIPLIGFRSPSVVDLVVATLDLHVPMVWEWFPVMTLKREGTTPFWSHKSTSKVFTKRALGCPLSTMWNRSKTLIT